MTGKRDKKGRVSASARTEDMSTAIRTHMGKQEASTVGDW